MNLEMRRNDRMPEPEIDETTYGELRVGMKVEIYGTFNAVKSISPRGDGSFIVETEGGPLNIDRDAKDDKVRILKQ